MATESTPGKVVSSFLDWRQPGKYGGPMRTTENPNGSNGGDRLMPLKETEHVSGLKKTAIYELMKVGKFPRSVRLSSRCVRWSWNQVQQFIQERIAASGSGQE